MPKELSASSAAEKSRASQAHPLVESYNKQTKITQMEANQIVNAGFRRDWDEER
jgi:hypothetical protein